ncbi:hypothetical protein QUF94_22755 [Peribacillus sp. NJ4]|uniref:hypothetical protein n=1 Tax=Peribacillus sp. NJ4 TaxID=3055862 RepID=UPI0025A2EE84|nr:hypothetical protein [Peribacillus sp. NJ4]MDM5214223.1 hypothetical protein [Peribacillus sp. NJ4]
MSLTNRDKQIIKALDKFRVMDCDSVSELFFAGLKNPKYAANNVLLRLLRDQKIQRSTAFIPYCYFGPNIQMKAQSQKIGHFLAILNVYKEMLKLGDLDSFFTEPKYGRKSDGCCEPDIYAYFRKTPFFIEVQKTVYSVKQMQEKLERYVLLYESGIIDKPFPHVLILSDQRYAIDENYPFKVFQSESFTEFVASLKSAPVSKPSERGVRIVVK